ncbi:MAG TPA: nucleotidyl transferase AbiEii/AbiGii toxin family protein [Thermoanaerobaculia bacterium]
MIPLQKDLQQRARNLGLPLDTVAKDYVIGHLLAAISAQPELGSALVFKGGTALKKLYFGEYRFSEDLDYTAVEAPSGKVLEEALRRAADEGARTLSERGPFTATLERDDHRDPHPGGQESFKARVQLPWQREPLCSIKIEITADEPVILPALRRPLLHGYDDGLRADVLVYVLEEIVAEKLRALLQSEVRRLKRGWTRPRARDFYDLWRILGDLHKEIDSTVIPAVLRQKCGVRGVSFTSADDFFPEGLLAEVNAAWAQSLAPLVSHLPLLPKVLSELRPKVERLLAE